jgi:hypothetical protein
MIRRLFALLMICVLALSGLAGIMPAAAQAGVTVNIRTVDASTGEPILSACFVLKDFSNTGCDENADGLIRYEGVPAGDYIVDQVQPAAGYVTVHDIPISVKASPATQTFTIRLDRVEANQAPSSNDQVTLYIRTIDASNQFALTQVCYQLQDFSNAGCDDNGDGRVAFEGLKDGQEFTVVQTSRPDGYLPVGAFPVTVVNDGGQQTVDVVMSQDRSTTDTVDVSVVPYDAATGR